MSLHFDAKKRPLTGIPVWITETPRTRTRTPATRTSKRKKAIQSDSHPEDEDTDQSNRTSKPKHRRKKGKKAGNEDHEPMQVDQVSTELEPSGPPPSTTELATRKSSSTRLAPTPTPTAMQGQKEGTESTKTHIGMLSLSPFRVSRIPQLQTSIEAAVVEASNGPRSILAELPFYTDGALHWQTILASTWLALQATTWLICSTSSQVDDRTVRLRRKSMIDPVDFITSRWSICSTSLQVDGRSV